MDDHGNPLTPTVDEVNAYFEVNARPGLASRQPLVSRIEAATRREGEPVKDVVHCRVYCAHQPERVTSLYRARFGDNHAYNNILAIDTHYRRYVLRYGR